MQLSSCDTGVQKFNERKSQNCILSLLMAIFIVKNYNIFQKRIEISCITDFDIFPTIFAALPKSPECPDDNHKNARAVIIDKVGGVGWVLTRLIGSLTVDH